MTIEASEPSLDYDYAMSTHKSLGYYGPGYDSPRAYEVTTRYVIVSSPRTGSNYVCARLNNFRDSLGLPMEYIHRDALAEIGARSLGKDGGPTVGPPTQVDVGDYMKALERRRTTADGYFGLKLQPAQLLSMTGGNVDQAATFLRKFDKLVVMLRKDKLAQAISGAIAQSTGQWFNFGEELVVAKERVVTLFPLIAKHLGAYLAEEALVKAVAARLADKPSLVVYHENLMEDPEALTRQIVTFLAPGLTALPPEDAKMPLTERPSGPASARIRADFLAYITDSPPA